MIRSAYQIRSATVLPLRFARKFVGAAVVTPSVDIVNTSECAVVKASRQHHCVYRYSSSNTHTNTNTNPDANVNVNVEVKTKVEPSAAQNDNAIVGNMNIHRVSVPSKQSQSQSQPQSQSKSKSESQSQDINRKQNQKGRNNQKHNKQHQKNANNINMNHKNQRSTTANPNGARKPNRRNEHAHAHNKPQNQNRNRPAAKKKITYNKNQHVFHSSKPIFTNWVEVSNIAPLSRLDDLLVDVQRIMSTELSVGIVDMDRAEEMLNHPSDHDDVDGDDDGDDNDNDDNDDNDNDDTPQPLPCWEPDETLPPHMVLEAHIMLSTLKRPMGWYLRFPNRSCVHALLSHIDESVKLEKEYKRMKTALNVEQNRKKKKKHGNGHGHGHGNGHGDNDNGDDDEDEDDNDNDNDELPEFSWKDYATRPLMCGWKRVKVEPFYWSQIRKKGGHPFYDDIKYTIGDNTIRVENCSKETEIDDVKFFFHRYDLQDERSIGIGVQNADADADADADTDADVNVNVDDGGTGDASMTPAVQLLQKNNNGAPNIALETNTFIVNFASVDDARTAVREKQSVEFMGRRIRLAQYSRQIFKQENENTL